MKKKEQALSHIKKDQEQTLLHLWLAEIQENPRLKDQELPQKGNLKHYSKQFLKKLFSTIKSPDIPTFSAETIKPVLNLWHQLTATQQDQGFSTRETALLIYTLRTSLLKYMDQHCDQKNYKNISELSQLGQLLDLLGMLTFEVYQVEKDTVIQRQSEQIHYLQTQSHSFQDKIIGNSPAMQQVFQTIGLILENDITVLLEGESGTGKDLLATIIHQHSKRKNKAFVTLNCGAIPKELIESELFGHEKGAFTSADKQRLGKFELAQEGTLFLDEVSELPLDMQVKLLRVLQNKEIERIGGQEKISINTRIIAASNKPLKTLVDEGKFRVDLFYRLHVFPIHVPALRERKSDIPLLATHFLNLHAKNFNLSVPQLSADASQFLQGQEWQGNVRELENTLQRALILSQGNPITAAILDFRPGQKGLQLPGTIQNDYHHKEFNQIEPLDALEKRYIHWALEQFNDNMSACAKALGLSRTTLYNKLKD